jgi:hypothetical protein
VELAPVSPIRFCAVAFKFILTEEVKNVSSCSAHLI